MMTPEEIQECERVIGSLNVQLKYPGNSFILTTQLERLLSVVSSGQYIPEAVADAEHDLRLILGLDREKEIQRLKGELAYVRLQRDKLLEITWLDLPGEPHESTERWREEFDLGWMRRAEADSLRAEIERLKQFQLLFRTIEDNRLTLRRANGVWEVWVADPGGHYQEDRVKRLGLGSTVLESLTDAMGSKDIQLGEQRRSELTKELADIWFENEVLKSEQRVIHVENDQLKAQVQLLNDRLSVARSAFSAAFPGKQLPTEQAKE